MNLALVLSLLLVVSLGTFTDTRFSGSLIVLPVVLLALSFNKYSAAISIV